MADLNVYLTTFNCGRTPVNVDYFAASLFRGLKASLPPDLVVLTLQEIAPISSSFLGGSLLAPYFTRFIDAVHHAIARQYGIEKEYETVAVENIGMTAIMVFAKPGLSQRIRWAQTAGVGVGLWEMGNKGAVGVRLGIDTNDDVAQTHLTFVAAHLAPMENAWQSRNEDWKSICEGLVFESDRRHGSGERVRSGVNDAIETKPLLSNSSETAEGGTTRQDTIFSPASYVFFAGDLNYRTSDSPPGPSDYKRWPKATDALSSSQHFSRLLEHDQLTRERNKKRTLHYLNEPPVEFPPTYKYSTAAQERVASHTEQPQDEEGEWLWAKHRVPSWCDRILYSAFAQPTVHSYTALPIQPTSDHRPVAMSFSIACAPAYQLEKYTPPFSIRSNWRQARASARRYELVVGLAAYMALTWEGEVLLAGTVVGIVGGYVILRAMIAS